LSNSCSAVVFAYHDVGARCLRVLLAHGVDVSLVVTHDDDPRENIWFERVADVATSHGLAVITAADPNAQNVASQIGACAPDFLFSFYYRSMLGSGILAIPRRGALNMHGSLLPKYRGRAPVNWAILHGERHTGATLHYMTAKPDAGDIVAQQAVPILPDDTALEVFRKVTLAAEIALDAALPALVAGTAPRLAQDLTQGSYFGGRKPEDGRVDWSKGAQQIHNLVRAVAPPYPGAFTTVAGLPARILRTRIVDPTSPPGDVPMLELCDGRIRARCGGGGALAVDAMELEGKPIDATELETRFGRASLPLEW
jgi:methionyl-tRNA formyltransferase